MENVVKSYTDRIRQNAIENGTGLYIELLRTDRFRSSGIFASTKESHELITQAIWTDICNDPDFRSIRSGWVLG